MNFGKIGENADYRRRLVGLQWQHECLDSIITKVWAYWKETKFNQRINSYVFQKDIL
jgi:hypothetical protein